MMFFSRLKQSSVPSRGSVAIIGSSPIAFLLADIIQTNNFKTTLVVSSKELAQNYLPKFLTIQSLSLQNHQVSFNYSDTLPVVDFCIIASKPEKAKTDVLLLSKNILNEIPVVNFSHLYNKDIIKELDISSVYPGYFNSWLISEKNTLKLLERKAEIHIQGTAEKITPLLPLFENSIVNTSTISPNKKYLWHYLIPYFLCNLILLGKPGQNLLSVLQQQDYREQINTAAKELCCIAKAQKESVSETDIFSKLYNVPNTYKTSISSIYSFQAFISLIPEINKFETPALYELLSSVLNKY